jgi:hypothetical protein
MFKQCSFKGKTGKPGMMVHTLIPVPRRWRQEDHKFEAKLGYIVRLCLRRERVREGGREKGKKKKGREEGRKKGGREVRRRKKKPQTKKKKKKKRKRKGKLANKTANHLYI